MNINRHLSSSIKKPEYWNILILLTGFLLSFYYITNIDVQWLTHEAKLLFAGGHYITDFIDPNPPLILCLYEPIQWLHHLAPGLSLSISSSIFFYTLIAASTARTQYLLKRDTSLPLFIGPIVALLLAIFPMNDQGEREVLILTLSMPYIIQCLSSDTSRKRHCIDTCFAAIGFLLKMQYLLIPLLLELFIWIKKSNHCKHALIIAGFSIAYIIAVFFITPNYHKEILPIIQHYYFRHFAYIPWESFLSEPSMGGCLLGLICCSLINRKMPSQAQHALLLAMLASFTIYIIPHQRFLYHDIPLISFYFLLSSLFLYRLLTKKGSWFSMRSTSLLVLLNTLCLIAIVAAHAQRSITETRYSKQLLHQFSIKNDDHIMPLFITSTRSVLSTLAREKENCSRFSGLWMITRFITNPETINLQDNVLQNRVQNWISDDIKRCQPNVILLGNESDLIGPILSFFTESPRFKKLWANYQLTHVIGKINYYQKVQTLESDGASMGTK